MAGDPASMKQSFIGSPTGGPARYIGRVVASECPYEPSSQEPSTENSGAGFTVRHQKRFLTNAL